MLEATPTAATLGDIYREEGGHPSNSIGYTMGSTSDPERFDLPAVSLDVTQDPVAHTDHIRSRYYGRLGIRGPLPQETAERLRRPTRFQARFRLIRDATEGTNRSLYVREGIYETNYTFEPTFIDERQVPDWREKMARYLKERRSNDESRQWGEQPQPRVYFWVPADMAGRSRQAELEHLDDMRRAWNLSLGHLCAVLRAAAGQGASEPEARQAAENDFLGRLDVAVRGLGRNMERWGEKYLDLCGKSKGRDVGDHSFALTLVDASAVPALPVTYLTGGPREENGRLFVKITTGTTRIPGHRTQDLIVY